MKRGLILINAYSNLRHSLNQSERLKEELERLGIAAEIRRNNFFAASIAEGGALSVRAEGFDFCVYLDKDKYVSEMLEKAGMRLFNRHGAIEACDDKMTTAIRLSGAVPMPETLAGFLCYDAAEPIPASALSEIEARLGYPLIAKTSYGSLGSGVFRIDDAKQLRAQAEALKCVPHLYQRFVASSFGRDMRVIVVGGECIAAMVRTSAGDFRSNLELGGVGAPIDPPESVKAMCEAAARTLDLDYCGVDVLFGEEGYLLCEVNSNAFFGGIERVTGINVAARYARHIRRAVYGV